MHKNKCENKWETKFVHTNYEHVVVQSREAKAVSTRLAETVAKSNKNNKNNNNNNNNNNNKNKNKCNNQRQFKHTWSVTK